MLQLFNIRKSYTTADFTQTALDGVSISFRDNEFVAILGPSGSGKTTLLNIVGGLDHYDEGNLVIDGVPTEDYRDRDWDTYRNNRIGFVFQSYNLIPHQTILANNATLAGHVHIGDWVIVGGLTGVHQFTHIGAHAMTGFQSHVSQDVPPYMMVSGNPLAVHGFNIEGLRRRGFSRERIAQVKQMHRLLYRDGLTLDQAKAAIAALKGSVPGDAEADADVQRLLDFLAASTRGIAR